MKQWDPTNRGALFTNDKKGNLSRPDYTGDMNVEGVEYRLSAWSKQSKGGLEYLSISVQRKDAQGARPAPRPAAKPKVEEEPFKDDEVPF